MLFDDGAIETVVDRVTHDELEVIVQRPESAKLKAEKDINLPDTTLISPALTDADDRPSPSSSRRRPRLVERRRPVEDLLDLPRASTALDVDVAIGLKIETVTGFNGYPTAAEHRDRTAARGGHDRARRPRGRIGYERLAEVQEELLWFCEAAHMPVIWATQVLESLAKTGYPSRAEVTDAAMGERAECVMLNKGPHIADAIRFVDDVLARMHEHQDKNTSLLRRLSVATALDDDGCARAPAAQQ